MSVSYTVPSMVSGVRVTDVPTSGQTVSGYGPRVPTRYMIRYGVRRPQWLRVRVMLYGNSGSAYVRVNGADLFIDSATEQRLLTLNGWS